MNTITLVVLMVFACCGGTQPIKPHELMKFASEEACISAKHKYEFHSDKKHAFECLRGVVVGLDLGAQ